MATDLDQMIENLLTFYNFKDKTIISVGAGGGQFYEYGFHAKHVIAIDSDPKGLESLKIALEEENLLKKFTLVASDFYDFKAKGDVLMFDFSLHEMISPEKAVIHALSMCPEVIINDHWPDSEWAYIVDEEIKVNTSWTQLKQFNPIKIKKYKAIQYFADYHQLFDKVKVQGSNTIKRIEKYKNHKNIEIPMSYGLVHISAH